MRLVGINLLKYGEKLAYPIYSTSGKVILNAGAVITGTYIDKLKKLGIFTVYIDDDKFNDIEITEVINFKTKSQAIQTFKQVYELFQNNKPLDEYAILDLVKLIVEDIKSNGTTAINFSSSIVMDDYLTGHSVNVCILSILIGNNMKYNFNQLVDLGVGALSHDIARGNDGDEMPQHVQKGFEGMKRYRGISLHSAKLIYEHHENYDGSGYPRGVSENNISEFARIVSIVDYYDALLLGNSKQNPMMPHEAYEALLAEADKRFDPDILQVFRNTIAFYPNGSTVKLSNGGKGVVIKQNKGLPHRPLVRIIEGEDVKEDIDLLTNLTVFIEAVDKD